MNPFDCANPQSAQLVCVCVMRFRAWAHDIYARHANRTHASIAQHRLGPGRMWRRNVAAIATAHQIIIWNVNQMCTLNLITGRPRATNYKQMQTVRTALVHFENLYWLMLRDGAGTVDQTDWRCADQLRSATADRSVYGGGQRTITEWCERRLRPRALPMLAWAGALLTYAYVIMCIWICDAHKCKHS